MVIKYNFFWEKIVFIISCNIGFEICFVFIIFMFVDFDYKCICILVKYLCLSFLLFVCVLLVILKYRKNIFIL